MASVSMAQAAGQRAKTVAPQQHDVCSTRTQMKACPTAGSIVGGRPSDSEPFSVAQGDIILSSIISKQGSRARPMHDSPASLILEGSQGGFFRTPFELKLTQASNSATSAISPLQQAPKFYAFGLDAYPIIASKNESISPHITALKGNIQPEKHSNPMQPEFVEIVNSNDLQPRRRALPLDADEEDSGGGSDDSLYLV
ncbi:hypothetical protein H0H92_010372 [Tricholoma furcatifolium]|nr:hypothetical protein H0H92_010372 [Tricholoma furcatifolium]